MLAPFVFLVLVFRVRVVLWLWRLLLRFLRLVKARTRLVLPGSIPDGILFERLQRGVAEVVVCCAMKTIASTSGRDVDDAAYGSSELS